MSDEMRIAAINAAKGLSVADVSKCDQAAQEIVEVSDMMGWQPRFGGGIGKHRLGKIGELGFWKLAEDNGISPEYDPFPANGYGKYSLRYDFSFLLPDRTVYGVDVKTGWFASKNHALRIDIDRWGMLVPQEQVDMVERRLHTDAFVYCVGWFDGSYRVAAIGWCESRDLEGRPVRKVGMDHPCVVVPIAELRPMSEFYNHVKNGSVSSEMVCKEIQLCQ